MTYLFSLSCSVLMSKFMRSPRSMSRGSLTRPGGSARTLLLLLRRGWRGRELLDQLLDLRSGRRTGAELQVGLVALHGSGRVAGLLGRLRVVEPGVRVLRRELRDRGVRGLDVREGELRPLAQLVHRRVGLLRRRLLELVRPERRAELPGRHQELARRRGLARVECVLVRLQEHLRLALLEPGELVPRGGVLLLQARVRLERADRPRRVGAALVGGGEVAEALRVRGMVLDLLLRLRDRGAAVMEDVEA